MAIFKFNFVILADKLQLCCYYRKEKKATRHYRVISDVLLPIDLQTWDNKKQCFMAPNETAIENNKRLGKIRTHWEQIAEIAVQNHATINNGKELFAYGAELERLQSNGNMTLGMYLMQLIERMKQGEDYLRPSKNFQLYITLLHKLEEEAHIINTPIDKVTDEHYKAFGAWLLNGKHGYKNNMVHFKSTINKANADNLTAVTLKYDYKSAIKNNANTEAQSIKNSNIDVLTLEQLAHFRTMDLTQLPKTPRKAELFRDFCLFMYEAFTRPCDTLKLSTGNICEINGKPALCLIPTKKKNHDHKKALQRTPITPTMRQIIDKYTNQSQNGYLFPFEINKRHWNLDNPAEFRTWNNAKQKQLEQINKFLKHVAVVLGAPVLTLYTFRRSAFTHAVTGNEIHSMLLAKRGGTSLDMLQIHYINPIEF